MSDNKHSGSSLDDVLKADGTLDHVTKLAQDRVEQAQVNAWAPRFIDEAIKTFLDETKLDETASVKRLAEWARTVQDATVEQAQDREESRARLIALARERPQIDTWGLVMVMLMVGGDELDKTLAILPPDFTHAQRNDAIDAAIGKAEGLMTSIAMAVDRLKRWRSAQ